MPVLLTQSLLQSRAFLRYFAHDCYHLLYLTYLSTTKMFL
jgi:hypothetical protein